MGNMNLVAGLSGSGKTYYCRDFVKRHPEYVYMNIDDFYTTYNGEPVHKNEFEVWITFFNAIHTLAVNGKNVIIESNALDNIDRAQFVRWFPEFDKHYLYWVWTDFLTAKENNLKRSRVIPEDEWRQMYHKTANPDKSTDREWDEICYIENLHNSGEYNIFKAKEKEQHYAENDK